MFSRPQLRLLSILALCVALAQATWLDDSYKAVFVRHEKKQVADPLTSLLGGVTSALGGALGTGSTTATDSSTTSTGKSTGKTTTTSSSVSSTSTTSSSSAAKTTSSSSSTTSSTSVTSAPTTSSTPEPTTSQSVVIITNVLTVSGSLTTSYSSSTSSITSKSTNPASLGENQTTSSGLTPKTKTTIIGVVCGVGGAIILVGLGIVAWRIWGRKKNEDEDDGLMGFRGGSSGHEKSGSVSATGPANPFQSTLENYHNPTKQVNASSNF
jgi:hypothetical protein